MPLIDYIVLFKCTSIGIVVPEGLDQGGSHMFMSHSTWYLYK